eukprot:scaffold57784_cov39-Prasinocladus_malaysianus.AAC.1
MHQVTTHFCLLAALLNSIATLSSSVLPCTRCDTMRCHLFFSLALLLGPTLFDGYIHRCFGTGNVTANADSNGTTAAF